MQSLNLKKIFWPPLVSDLFLSNSFLNNSQIVKGSERPEQLTSHLVLQVAPRVGEVQTAHISYWVHLSLMLVVDQWWSSPGNAVHQDLTRESYRKFLVPLLGFLGPPLDTALLSMAHGCESRWLPWVKMVIHDLILENLVQLAFFSATMLTALNFQGSDHESPNLQKGMIAQINCTIKWSRKVLGIQ